MKYILYIVAIVMLISWAIGFFVFSLGAIIHLLLVIALVSLMVKVFSGDKSI
ncbi:MAG: lmo0937 family membrane protein [Bacteroidota bacterium]